MNVYNILTITPFYVVGCYVFLKILMELLKVGIINLRYKIWPINFPLKYGSDSYVLITGASDGLGKAFAFMFASKGLNLILVARNQKKLEEVKMEIKKQNKSTKIEIFVCDFVDSFDSGFFARLFEFTSKFDVSIVVNNVGIVIVAKKSSEFYLAGREPSYMLELMTVNTVPQTLIHFYYERVLLNRKSKSAFIDVSSIASLGVYVTNDIYGATKKFNWYLSDSLGNSHGNSNLESLCYVPGMIDTNLLASIDFKKPLKNFILCVSPKKAAENAVKGLGITHSTYGVVEHCINAGLYTFLGYFGETWIIATLSKKLSTRVLKSG